MSESTVVWVANRNNPLTDSSGVLTISENDNLVVLTGQKQVVWSTNVSNIAFNSTAQLLDSGNLVLIDGDNKTVWESFQHPCNTLLQDMKLSTNQKTGEKVQATSWKSASDPSFGRFSCGVEPRNVTEVFMWEDNRPYWRSGPWNGQGFIGISRMASFFLNGFRLEETDGTFDLFFSFANQSILRTYSISPEGEIEQRLWNFQTKEWELERAFNHESECDRYGMCGPFGICNYKRSPICSCLRGYEPKNKEEWDRQNWSSGCLRREALKCERVKSNGSEATGEDGFVKVENAKVPDMAEWLPYQTKESVDCRTPCLNNCSCLAYAFDEDLGCMFWRANLLDTQSFSQGGVDLYIRLAYSELGTLFN